MNIVINFGRGAMTGRGVVAAAAGAVLVASLAACGSSTAAPPGSIAVVASTNVYGDLVRDVAGRSAGHKIQITSIITDPSVDPHSYEASTRTELAISRADLIVENGGGYDDFVDRLRESAGGGASLINAVGVSGKPQTGSLNEHVWYDFPTVEKVVGRIADFLAAHDKKGAAGYRANARALIGRLHALESEEAALKKAVGGARVAITEPLPRYLLDACGLVDRTPPEFSRAVEAGTDVAPRVMQDTLDLFSRHVVRALVYNEQTAGAATDKVIAAAKGNDIPTVPVTETLPAGRTYLEWMHDNLAAIAGALRASLN
jgi:zinc/manganese transport system substrate-binding protein